MQLLEVHAKLQGIEVFEARSVTAELLDLVFENKVSDAWHARLESILGAPLKPAGAKSNTPANQIAKPFGGIRPEQSLYYHAYGDYAVVAMLWPWQNGRCTTCKIFHVINQTVSNNPSLFDRWFKK